MAAKSIANIAKEVKSNRETIRNMIERHLSIKATLDSVFSLNATHSEDDEDIEVLLNFELVSSTSWETAQMTKAISYMDIDRVQQISEIYKLQAYYETIVKDYVLKNLFSPPDEESEKFKKRMQYFLSAIIPVQQNLDLAYKYLLEEVLTDVKGNF